MSCAVHWRDSHSESKVSLLRTVSQFLIASWFHGHKLHWLSELYVLEGHVSGVKSSKLGSQMWDTLFLRRN